MKVWVVNVTPPLLYPQKRDPIPFVQEAGWASGPVWMGVGVLAPTTFRTLMFGCTDYPFRLQEIWLLDVTLCQKSGRGWMEH